MKIFNIIKQMSCTIIFFSAQFFQINLYISNLYIIYIIYNINYINI